MNVETKKRANSAYTKSIQDGNLVLDFGLAVGKIVFNPNRVSAENRARAMLHGFTQRIIDAGALSAGDNGKVSAFDKFAEMDRVAEHLMSGSTEWNIKATPKPSGPDAGLTIRAMIALGKAETPDHAERLFAAIGAKREIGRDGVIALFWAAKDVATKVAELRAADRSYAVSADDLLDGIDLEEGDAE